jgi:hypothetical protein
MKNRSLILSAVTLLVLVCSVSAASALANWWHGLSQNQRNTEIRDVALNQVGQNTGMQCKHWVQEVVYSASQGTVYPPANQNDYTWHSSSNVRTMLKPFPIEWAQPGQIIQMRWKNQNGTTYPHTAILKSKTSTKMYWVDCNWYGDTTVNTHSVTYNDFNRAVGNKYNVYEIK